MNHAIVKLSRLGLMFWLLIPLYAAAETGTEPAEAATGSSQPAAAQPATGSAAQWLEIQREGKMPGKLLPIPGDEASVSYQRYLDSFAQQRQAPSATATSSAVK